MGVPEEVLAAAVVGEAGLGWIGQVGGWAGMVALTALLFWGLSSSRLYTRAQHESIVSLHEKRAATQDKVIEQQAAQIAALLEGSGAAKDFFEKVPVTGGIQVVGTKPKRRKESGG